MVRQFEIVKFDRNVCKSTSLKKIEELKSNEKTLKLESDMTEITI